MSDIGIIILAAGASTRLGSPKQLLSYQGKPLLRHMAEVALHSDCQPIVVVLGAYAEKMKPHLADLNIYITHNPDWLTGMASSIECGLKKIQAIAPHLNAIILMLCDQPFVSPHLIQQLVARYQRTQSLIVASEYADILGVPALFDRALFPELANLKGDIGARRIIHQYHANALSIPFAQGIIDLDTPSDINFLS